MQMKLFSICRDACAEYLEQQKEAEKQEHLPEIQHYETEMSNKTWIKPAATDTEDTLQDTLLNLEFFARYTEYYTKNVCKAEEPAWDGGVAAPLWGAHLG